MEMIQITNKHEKRSTLLLLKMELKQHCDPVF